MFSFVFWYSLFGALGFTFLQGRFQVGLLDAIQQTRYTGLVFIDIDVEPPVTYIILMLAVRLSPIVGLLVSRTHNPNSSIESIPAELHPFHTSRGQVCGLFMPIFRSDGLILMRAGPPSRMCCRGHSWIGGVKEAVSRLTIRIDLPG